MMRLTRLSVYRYLGVAPGTSLVFSRGINVVLGRNGTGKTTLLNLIAMIARSDFSLLEERDCHVAFAMELGDAMVEMELENHPVGRFGQKLPPFGWRYRIVMVQDGDTAVLEVADGEVRHASPGMGEPPAAILQHFRLFEVGLFDWLVFVGSHLSGSHGRAVPIRMNAIRAANEVLDLGFPSANAGRFDEGLAVFDRIVGPMLPAPTLIPDHPELRVSTRVNDRPDVAVVFCPPELVARVSQDVGRTSELDENPAYQDLEITRRIALAVDAIQVTARPRFLGGGHNHAIYGRFDFTIDLDPQTRITHDALSFGQKRRLAFLWYLACNPQGIVIADELVNGFHHDWVAESIDDIGDRQAFVASQNPLLLDFLTFDSAEEVRAAFVFCSSDPQADGRRGWRWTNMSPDDAESFFRAFGVGIQHVSSILRTKGLW